MINCVVIGTGNIGTDLILKLNKNKNFNLLCVFGRSNKSQGVKIARKKKILVYINKIYLLNDLKNEIDIIFDASSAEFHAVNFKKFSNKKSIWIDLTPSGIGNVSVPFIFGKKKISNNFSCITCGAQSSIPLIYALNKHFKNINYIEVVSTISANSAGLATRLNIDKYLTTTEKAIEELTNTSKAKSILIINPAKPPIDMTTTITIKGNLFKKNLIKNTIKSTIINVKSYINEYGLMYEPIIDSKTVKLSLKIKGAGDYLPSYAGNLDIITAAAIKIAEQKRYEYKN